jgi:hypothetical protein
LQQSTQDWPPAVILALIGWAWGCRRGTCHSDSFCLSVCLPVQPPGPLSSTRLSCSFSALWLSLRHSVALPPPRAPRRRLTCYYPLCNVRLPCWFLALSFCLFDCQFVPCDHFDQNHNSGDMFDPDEPSDHTNLSLAPSRRRFRAPLRFLPPSLAALLLPSLPRSATPLLISDSLHSLSPLLLPCASFFLYPSGTLPCALSHSLSPPPPLSLSFFLHPPPPLPRSLPSSLPLSLVAAFRFSNPLLQRSALPTSSLAPSFAP